MSSIETGFSGYRGAPAERVVKQLLCEHPLHPVVKALAEPLRKSRDKIAMEAKLLCTCVRSHPLRVL